MMNAEKRILPVAFWVLSGLEALGTLVVLLFIPPDPKHAILAGFSFQRLLMLVGSALLSLLFLALAWASTEGRPLRVWTAQQMNDRKTGWLVFGGVGGAIGSAWLLVFTPPTLQGATIERLQPYLLLMILMVVQGMLTIWRLSPERFRAGIAVLSDDLTQLPDRPMLGWGLLGLSFLIGLATVFFTYYNLGDEGDTLTVGWLISLGGVLYRDIFSHHFPFPYLWVGLVMRLFGPSILAARLSVVVLRTLVFAGTIHFSRWYLPAGLTVLGWALIGPLFLGNMLLYDAFGALLLVPAILTAVAVLCGRAAPTRPALGFMGGLVALAVLSDPIAVAPGVLILAVLGISGFLAGKSTRERLKTAAYRMGLSLGIALAIGLIFILGLVTTQSLGEFFRQAIWFNQAIYSQYAPMPPILDLFKSAFNGLDVLNPIWRRFPGLYYQWTSYAELDSWVFMGLFLRLAVIACTASLLLQKKWLSAGLIYLTASFLLWRAQMAMHAQAFILFGTSCAALVVGGAWTDRWSGLFSSARHPPKGAANRLMMAAQLLLVLPIGGMLLWQDLRGGQFWLEQRAQLSYQEAFSGLEGNGGFYRQMSCNQADATILIYPGKMLDYLAAQLPPATRYPFMLPWVADVGQGEVISDLHRLKDRPILVYLEKDADVWGYPVSRYLHDLIDELDREYIPKGQDVYLSPGLQARCAQFNP